MSRMEPYGRVYFEAVTGGGYSSIPRFADNDVVIQSCHKVVHVYTADQIRSLVEEVRAEWERDAAFSEATGVPVPRHSVSLVFNALLARLDPKL